MTSKSRPFLVSLQTVIRSYLSSLRAKDLYYVLQFRYGLDGEDEKTFEEVGAHLGVSRQRVQQKQSNAIRHLRNYFSQIPLVDIDDEKQLIVDVNNLKNLLVHERDIFSWSDLLDIVQNQYNLEENIQDIAYLKLLIDIYGFKTFEIENCEVIWKISKIDINKKYLRTCLEIPVR